METLIENYRQAMDRLQAAQAEWDKYLPSEAEPVIDRAQPGIQAAYEELTAAESAFSEARKALWPGVTH